MVYGDNSPLNKDSKPFTYFMHVQILMQVVLLYYNKGNIFHSKYHASSINVLYDAFKSKKKKWSFCMKVFEKVLFIKQQRFPSLFYLETVFKNAHMHMHVTPFTKLPVN